MTPRVPNVEVNDVIRQFRRASCGDTSRALAVALVEARLLIAELRARQLLILDGCRNTHTQSPTP